MTLDLSKLKSLEGNATPFDVQNFFSQNLELHPNNHIAGRCNDATKALLKTGVVDGHTTYMSFTPALFAAICVDNSSETVQLYLDHPGTDLNHQNGAGKTALHLAISYNNKDAMQALVNSDRVDPNMTDANGNTALHLAVSYKNYDAITALINSERVDPNTKDASGNTALHLAAINDDLKAVELLLSNTKKKLELSKNKAGSTAIAYADQATETPDVYNRLCEYRQYISTIEALKNPPKAEVNKRDTSDLSLLHWAVADEDVQAVKELLANGVEISKTATGYTPLDYAIAVKNDEIAGLISNYILSNQKTAQKVNTCTELVLYRNPTDAPTDLAAKWFTLNRSIEELLSKGQPLPGTAKATTFTLPSFPPVKEAPLAITNGAKVAASEAGSPDNTPTKAKPVARRLNLDTPEKVPGKDLVMVPYVPLNGNGTLAVFTPKVAEVKAGIKKVAKKAAWFSCSTALYALAIIPVLAIATKLYFVAQGHFEPDDAVDLLHEGCLAASLDTRSFYDILSPAPQSYVECMGVGV